MTPKTDTLTLIKAMRHLANDIQSDDGVANAAIAEAADRLAELERENAALKQYIANKICPTCDWKALLEAQEKENTTLRADKERLDWLLTDDGGFWVNWMYDKDEWMPELKASRDAIDACRNGRIGREKP